MTVIEEPNPSPSEVKSQIEKPNPISQKPPAPKVEFPNSSPAKVQLFNVNHMDLRTYLKHIALWNDPLLSAKYLGLIFSVYYFTMEGEGSFTLIGFFCYILTLRIIAVSGIHFIGEQLKKTEYGVFKSSGDILLKANELIKSQTKTPTPQAVSFWIEGVSTYLETKINDGISVINRAESDFGMLKVVLYHLVGIYVLFWLVSLKTLIFVTLFLALSVPAIYSRYYEKIDPLYEKVESLVKPHCVSVEAKSKELGVKIEQKVQEAVDNIKKKYYEFKEKRSAGHAKTN